MVERKKKMFTTYREWLKYGNEGDEVELTIKEWDSLDKAIEYAHRYAKGIKFVGCSIENEAGSLIYEICDYGSQVFDHRKEFGLA